MTLDLFSQLDFGNAQGLRDFLLAHRFIHDAYQPALLLQFGAQFPTFALSSNAAEEEWAALMRTRRPVKLSALEDWLKLHAQLHTSEYAAIGGAGNIAPDLSVVDLSQPQQFYDWMYAHQQMHDYTGAALGVT